MLRSLLGACVFRDGLGSFADGVLRQLTRQQQSNGSLNLSTSDRRTLVVVSQSGRFGGDTLENVVHEAVHDAHRFARNTGVGMHLLQHFVNVNGVAFLSLALLLLVAFRNVLLGLAGLLGGLSASLRWHVAVDETARVYSSRTKRTMGFATTGSPTLFAPGVCR